MHGHALITHLIPGRAVAVCRHEMRGASGHQPHPEITYVIAPFDSSATFAAQGIRQAGNAAVKLVSGEGDPDGLTRVRNGQQAADLATVPAWAGWAAADDLLRAFQGKAVTTYTLPQRLFSKANAPAGTGGWADGEPRRAFDA